MAPATSVIAYLLWPSLTLAIVILWLAAMLDIARHRRRGTFSGAGLLGMATLVSLVAAIAVAGIGVVLAERGVEAASRADTAGNQAGVPEDEGRARAYIFSFGLENASYGSPVDPAGTQESRNRAPH